MTKLKNSIEKGMFFSTGREKNAQSVGILEKK